MLELGKATNWSCRPRLGCLAPSDFKANCVAKTSCTSWKALGFTYPPKPKHLEERKRSPVTRNGNFPQNDEVFACSESSCIIIESHNHGMVWAGGEFKVQPVPAPCHGQGYFPLDQAAQTFQIPDVCHVGRDGWSGRKQGGREDGPTAHLPGLLVPNYTNVHPKCMVGSGKEIWKHLQH